MTHNDQNSFCRPGGLPCSYRVWLPPQEPKAVLAVVHGVCEHGGRYARLAGALTARGYAVYAIDLCGHGCSAGERIFIGRFDDYLDDVELWLGIIRDRHPGKPLFLMGQSMGGAIVGRFGILRPDGLQGLVLSAPAVRVGGHVFPLLRHLAGLVGRVLPRLRLVRVGTHWLSRDRAVIEEFRQDPLVYQGKFPTRTGAEILRAARELNKNLAAIRLPLLVLHGTGDWITDPRGSVELYEQARSTDKTLKLYDGLYHDLFHEPEWPQVTADLVAWLDQRV